jgi:acyl-CoA reductase-like NAD-dependent aldehyde dehydrogenase
MPLATETTAPIRKPDCFFIGGEWVTPSTSANFDVIEAATERLFVNVSEARDRGHNAMRSDFGITFGGLKQSGIGREGGREGLLAYLETKTVIMDEPTARYRAGPDSAASESDYP